MKDAIVYYLWNYGILIGVLSAIFFSQIWYLSWFYIQFSKMFSWLPTWGTTASKIRNLTSAFVFSVFSICAIIVAGMIVYFKVHLS
jgi:hypothetical protein